MERGSRYELFRKKVSKRKKEKIEKNAKMVGALLDDNAVVNHIRKLEKDYMRR